MNGPTDPAEEGALLSLNGIGVRFGARVALKNVSFSVAPGEFVALTGPNGSGKSTLLRVALGLELPEAGTVRLGSRRLAELSIRERARRVAWLPQEELPLENVRVGEYALYGRTPYLAEWEGDRTEDRELARRAVERVGLLDRWDSGIQELSGGERQRILLARALAQETPLLLLDEPTAHLDIAYQLDLLGRVRELCQDRRHAAIAALHDLNLAARFADRVVVLSHGRLIVDGPPRAVLSEDLLRTVWGVSAVLREDPRTGLPYLLPRLAPAALGRSDRGPALPGPIHVVAGGGAGEAPLRLLLEEGYSVTAGPLNLLDTDAQVADELGIPFPPEVPFAPLGPEVRARHREMLSGAEMIVVAPFAVGPSNLANLEDLLPFLGSKRVVLVQPSEIRARDFAGGRASEAIDELRRRGAGEVDGLPSLLVWLRSHRPAAAGSERLPSAAAPAHAE